MNPTLCFFLTVCVQVEKTRHYLLLREKLESSLLLGQDSLCSKDLMDSPKAHSPCLSPASGLGLDSPNERQKELAAKVTSSSLSSPTVTHWQTELENQNFTFPPPSQCLRLLMHTFNRQYSQVSSSASESKVSLYCFRIPPAGLASSLHSYRVALSALPLCFFQTEWS